MLVYLKWFTWVILYHFLLDRPPIILNSSVLVTQLCLTLWEQMECSPPGPSVQGILQAGILEREAIPFSRGSSPSRDGTQVSCIAGSFFSFSGTGKPLHWLFGLFAYMTQGHISSSALGLFWLAGMCYGLSYKDSISWLLFLKLAKQRRWKASHAQERQTRIFLTLQNVGWYL